MQYIFLFILRGPWVVQLIVGGLIAWGGLHLHRDNTELLAAQTALLAMPQPPVTTIADFTPRREGQRVVEARVLAQIDFDATTLLVKKINGMTTSEDLMFVLLDADATSAHRQARAVMLIDPDEEEIFRQWAMSKAVGLGERGPVVLVEGIVSSSGNTLVQDALKERGFDSGGADFHLTPFLHGRSAGLSSLQGGRPGIVMGVFVAAGLLWLMAGVKLWRWWTRRGAPNAMPVPSRAASAASLVAAAAPAPSGVLTDLQRKGRLRRVVVGGVLTVGAVILWLTGSLGVALMLGVMVTLYLGSQRLIGGISRGIGVAAVSGLDRLTGLQAAHDRAEAAVAQAGPQRLDQGALIESRAADSRQQKIALMRWAPFGLGVVALVGMAALNGGVDGIKGLGHDLITPFTGASPLVMTGALPQPVGTEMAPAALPSSDAAPPRGQAGLMPQAILPESLLWVGLTLLLAFAASYVQRWFTHRNALPLEDPLECLDARLRLRRDG